MQRIEIEFLGPIQHLKLDVKDYNVIIGEQATGKSTLAKCIYFFRNIKDEVTEYLYQLYDEPLCENGEKEFHVVLKRKLKQIFISLFGFSWDLNEKLYLKYEYADGIWIDVVLNHSDKNSVKKKKYISVRYSPKLTKEIKWLQKEVHQMKQSKNKLEGMQMSLSAAINEQNKVHTEIKKQINRIFNDEKETYYIPAGRSMLTLLANQKSMVDNENLDFITLKYMRVIERIQGLFSEGIENVYKHYPDGERKFNVNEISKYLIDSIKGNYYYSKGKERIILCDSDVTNRKNVEIPINFASSGQQEILWLVNLLYVLILKKEKAFVIIEEPEVHLYPNLQRKIIEFISFFVKMSQGAVFITTHSPYVLTSVNILYVAGSSINMYPHKSKRIRDKLDLKAEILPDSFLALKLNKDGTMEDLVDEEMGELRTELIDEISDQLNELYREIFYINEEE